MVASDLLCKSKRLTELFLYLSNRVLDDSAEHINELELGHHVFGRPVFYDTASDNIVRVHASTLRKRLAEYFQTQGRDEALLIEIPRGNYAPVFKVRECQPTPSHADLERVFYGPPPAPALPAALESAHAQAQPLSAPQDSMRWPLALLVIALTIVCGYLLVRTPAAPPRANSHAGFDPGSSVGQFWTEVFPPGGTAEVVLDDSSLDFYQQITNRRVSLEEYYDRSYLTSVYDRLLDPHLDPKLIRAMLLRRQSTFADVSLLSRLSAAATQVGSSDSVFFGRDLAMRELKSSNLVLLGTSQSNPWIQPFEPRLAIRWKIDDATTAPFPVDQTEGPSRETQYKPPPDPASPREGYATVALLPNLGSSGNVLIVTGTGGPAIAAALDFITDEASMKDLRSRLSPRPFEQFPEFEILLRVGKGTTLPRTMSIIKCRRPDEFASH